MKSVRGRVGRIKIDFANHCGNACRERMRKQVIVELARHSSSTSAAGGDDPVYVYKLLEPLLKELKIRVHIRGVLIERDEKCRGAAASTGVESDAEKMSKLGLG